MSDDLTGSYMNSRADEQMTEAGRVIAQMQQESIEKDKGDTTTNDFLNATGSDPITDAIDTVSSIAGDVGMGAIEAPRQILGGFMDAVNEAALALESAVPLGTLGGDEFTRETAATTDEARSTTGGLIRGVSQFVTGFIPALKGAKVAGITNKTARVMGAGAATDAFAFDPHEERLANLVEDFPALSNPVARYLESDPDDSDAEGRFKNAIEGMGLGLAMDGFVKTVKVLRAGRIEKAAERQMIVDKDAAKKLAEVEPAIEGEFIPFEEKAAQSSPEFGTGAGKAGDEAAQNINLSNIDSVEEIDNLIRNVGEQDAPKINEARREVITLAETEKLADNLGMSVEELLDRRKGQAFNAEQAVASRKILVASGESVFKLAKKAATGSDEDVVLFARAMAQHRAIQAQVSGLTAEAGRALGSFRIQAKSAAAQERAISEALSAGGGSEHMKDIATAVSQFDEVHQLNGLLKKGATKPEMFFEAWINMLLSSPTTHAVNVLSNSIVVGWSAGERVVASAISKGFGDGAISSNEAVGQMFGIIQGGKDGMRLAWHAIKTGEASDPLQKIEGQQFKRITAENLELTGVPGRFADFVGESIRVPGRLLTAGDELFKSMGYRMELNAQAYRTAAGEGLHGDEMAKRIQDVINNPPENIHLAAIDASRYQTFTKELGPVGQKIQQGVKSIDDWTMAEISVPSARLIVPFIRTPTNIMKWVGERTPLAPINSSIRADIKAGGARRDMALAKIATGSMTMAIAADYTMSGDITGGGPTNPAMRNILRTTGWQPYSIKVGDTYFAYGRLDPIGAFIGLAADTAEIMGQTSDADTLDLTMSAVTAVAQNVTSKTYLSGLAEFFDVMSSISADPEGKNTRIKKWITRMAGTVVPSGVAQLERTLSPEMSASNGIIEKIKSRLPGYSDDLPPRRNIFGEPIVLSGGLGPDIMSPIYTSEERHDPIADEIVKQGTLLRMPMRNINGVELTTHQYDDYILFYSGKDNEYVDFQPLKSTLKEQMSSDLYVNGTDGPDGLKSEVITRVFAAYRNGAKQSMLDKYPEIKNEIDRKKLEDAAKMRGF